MLAPVSGLVETVATPPTFTWDADPDADSYLVGVDQQAPVSVAVDAVSVSAPEGPHTLRVAPGLLPTAEVVLGFSVAGPPPPPPPANSTLVPVLVGAGILGAAALAVSARTRRPR